MKLEWEGLPEKDRKEMISKYIFWTAQHNNIRTTLVKFFAVSVIKDDMRSMERNSFKQGNFSDIDVFSIYIIIYYVSLGHKGSLLGETRYF